MGARELLARLTDAGLSVALADGDRLVVTPAARLTDALRTAIRADKAGLLDQLRQPEQTKAPSDPRCTDRARAYRLSPADLDRAHARPWENGAIARFQARAGRFVRLGFSAQDAEDLAERLALRDAGEDDRCMCVDCAALSGFRGGGFRCATPGRAGLGVGRDRAQLGSDFATLLQRCGGFRAASEGRP